MGFSKDHFMQKMVKLIDLMSFKLGKGTLEALFEKVYWHDPRALENAIFQMEDEDRWNSKVFLKHIRLKNSMLMEEMVDQQKANDFRKHVEMTRQTEDCPGGDRCRKCGIKFCDTVAAYGYQGIRDVLSGKKTVKEVNDERSKRFPVGEPF